MGFQIMLAAASEHEVWMITRENNLRSVKAALRDHPLRERIHLVGLDVDGMAKRVKKRGGLLTLHWYYDAWQRRAARLAARLDREVDFDVVHHVTFASYWTRVGVASVDKPLIWGPVGGAVTPPLRLLPMMGLQGAIGDLSRAAVRPLAALVTRPRRTAARASVTLAQNRETASRLGPGRVRILPNALLAAETVPRTEPSIDPENPRAEVVFAGRLIGLKAPGLAVCALAQLGDHRLTLRIYGNGPQRNRLLRLTRVMESAARVELVGEVARERLMEELGKAAVLLHPALHEEAGFVVAEALAMGIPVVALDRGGPPVITAFWPEVPSRLVPSSSSKETARSLARAVSEVQGRRGRYDPSPADTFRRQMLAAYREAAGETTT